MKLYKINCVILLIAAILCLSSAQQTGVSTGIRPIGPGTPVAASAPETPAEGVEDPAKRHVKRGAFYGGLYGGHFGGYGGYGGLYGGYGYGGYGYGGYPYHSYGYGYDWPYYGGYYGGFGWPHGYGYGYY